MIPMTKSILKFGALSLLVVAIAGMPAPLRAQSTNKHAATKETKETKENDEGTYFNAALWTSRQQTQRVSNECSCLGE